MPTTTYVARNLGDIVGPDNLDAYTLATIVGSDPLATSDGATSYARVETSLTTGAQTGFSFDWDALDAEPPPTAIITRARVWADWQATYGNAGLFRQYPSQEGVSSAGAVGAGYSGLPAHAYGDPWQLSSTTLNGTGRLWIDPGTRWWFLSAFRPSFGMLTDYVTDVTRLWMVVEWEGPQYRPLRWRQRSDGLGGGSPAAARGARTQQGSIRHRGIL